MTKRMRGRISNGISLINGDCLEVMKSMQDKCVDFILTDIPYELELHGGGAHGDFKDRKHVQPMENSSLYFISQGIDYDKVFSEFIRILKAVNICLFCSNKQVGKIMTWWEQRGYVATILVWDKPNPIPLANHKYVENLEFIIYIREKGVTFNNLGYNMQLKSFRYQPPRAQNRLHETEKPLSLLSHLIYLHTIKDDLVFDPFAGSFSTAIACIETQRRFVGCEILEKYYNPALERVRSHQQKLKLLFD